MTSCADAVLFPSFRSSYLAVVISLPNLCIWIMVLLSGGSFVFVLVRGVCVYAPRPGRTLVSAIPRSIKSLPFPLSQYPNARTHAHPPSLILSPVLFCRVSLFQSDRFSPPTAVATAPVNPSPWRSTDTEKKKSKIVV